MCGVRPKQALKGNHLAFLFKFGMLSLAMLGVIDKTFQLLSVLSKESNLIPLNLMNILTTPNIQCQ